MRRKYELQGEHNPPQLPNRQFAALRLDNCQCSALRQVSLFLAVHRAHVAPQIDIFPLEGRKHFILAELECFRLFSILYNRPDLALLSQPASDWISVLKMIRSASHWASLKWTTLSASPRMSV